MSILASELIARITVQGAKEAQAQLTGVGNATDRAGGLLKGALVMGAIGAGVAIVGLGIKAVKMAGDYQESMTRLVTGAGESEKNLGMVSKGILDIAVQTGTASDQLSAAMFEIESGGYRASQGLQVLKIAAEGARVGNSDLTKTTDVLLTTMHNYHLASGQATGAMNSLIVTMQNGRMVMDDLNAALIKVLPTAAALKVPLADVQGALDSMAASGDKGAAAGTHLEMMLKMLANPVGAAAKEMKAMGINSVDLAQTMRTSLPDALQMIQDAVARHFVPGSVQYNRAVADILGGSKSGVAGLEIMAGGMKLLQDNTNAAAAALANGGDAVQGWDKVQQDFNFKLDQAKSMLGNLGITLGTQLLPIVTPLVSRFADWVVSMTTLASKTDFSGLASTLKDLANGAGNLFEVLGNVLNALRPLAPIIRTVTPELIALWAAFKLLSIGGAVSSSITAMTTFGTTASTVGTTVTPLSLALRGLAVDIGTIGVGATAAIGGLTLLDAALLTNMYATQQADDAAIGSKQKGSAALQAYTNQEIADLEKLHSQGLIKSASDWDAWKQSIAGTLQKLANVSYDEAQKMAQDVINAAKNMQSVTNQNFNLMADQWQRWLKYLQAGGQKPFDAFRADDNKATEDFLKNQMHMGDVAASTGAKFTDVGKKTHDRLVELNQNLKQSSVDAQNKTTENFLHNQMHMGDVAASTGAKMQDMAEKTRKKLELLNGPFDPKVNLGDLSLAMTEADAAYWKFQRLNGTSHWTAYLQQVTIGAASPAGGPRAHASGIMNNPIGHWAMVGEQGPELMYVPQGASIYPHQQSVGMTGNSPINVNVYLDGAPVAKKLMPHIVQNIRTSTGVRI